MPSAPLGICCLEKSWIIFAQWSKWCPKAYLQLQMQPLLKTVLQTTEKALLKIVVNWYLVSGVLSPCTNNRFCVGTRIPDSSIMPSNLFPRVLSDKSNAPQVLAVGKLLQHVQAKLWRNAEVYKKPRTLSCFWHKLLKWNGLVTLE